MPTTYTGSEICFERYTVTATAVAAASGTLQLNAAAFPPGRVVGVHVVKKTAFNVGIRFNVAADTSETVATEAEVAATSVSPDTVECAGWKTSLNTLLRSADRFLYAKSAGVVTAGEMDLIVSYVPASPEY